MTVSNVMIETDSKTLVVALQALNVPYNQFGDLVSECKCKNLLSNNSDYVVSFIKRRANMVVLEPPYIILSPYVL